jgi:diguanylate cyclase (GGDEF)-like protein
VSIYRSATLPIQHPQVRRMALRNPPGSELTARETVVMLHECSRNQGLDIAERIRIAIGTTPIEKDGQHIAISASVGLAATDTSGYGLQRLCKAADVALYRARRAGRNRVIADAGNLAEA